MASVDFAPDVVRDVADAVEIGDRRSAKFHYQTGHLQFTAINKTMRRLKASANAGYIPARSGGCNISRLCENSACRQSSFTSVSVALIFDEFFNVHVGRKAAEYIAVLIGSDGFGHFRLRIALGNEGS